MQTAFDEKSTITGEGTLLTSGLADSQAWEQSPFPKKPCGAQACSENRGSGHVGEVGSTTYVFENQHAKHSISQMCNCQECKVVNLGGIHHISDKMCAKQTHLT